MGTMIQRHRLDGGGLPRRALRAPPAATCKGNNDVLVLTRPDVIREIHDAVPRGRRRHHRDQHLQQHGDRAGRLRPRGARLRAERRRRAASRAQAADEWTARTPDRPRFVAGAIGPTNRTLSISPDVNDPAFRAVTFDELRDAYARAGARPASTAASTCCWSRRSSTRSTRRPRSSPSTRCSRRAARRAAGHDLGHDHRPQRPHAVGPDRRGVLDRRSRTRSPFSVGHQLRARRARDAAVPRGARRASPTRASAAIRTPACRTRSASTTSSRPRPAAMLARVRRRAAG